MSVVTYQYMYIMILINFVPTYTPAEHIRIPQESNRLIIFQ